jgi:hypothetical protein
MSSRTLIRFKVAQREDLSVSKDMSVSVSLPRWPFVVLLLALTIAGGVLGAGTLMGAFGTLRDSPAIEPNPATPVAVRAEVGGVKLAVPRDLIRFEPQRKDGTHPRLDLAFAWPSLEGRGQLSVQGEAFGSLVFLSLQPRDEALDPARRMAQIYMRFLSTEIHAAVPGLAARRFVEGSGYDGEELVYDPVRPGVFFLRCARTGGTPQPSCIRELRIAGIDVTYRMSRQHLDDWRGIEAAVQSLVAAIGLMESR